jgi:Flp pilus assembly protein TadB
LFTWWVISISFSIVFLTIVSIYLYANRACERTEGKQKTKAGNFVKNFVFVWVLIGLLIFYIVTVNLRSAELFAAGNIVVEIILITYLLMSRKERTEQPEPQN